MAEDRQAYAERLGADLALIGFPRMPARVFAAISCTDSGRLTSAELSEQLQASPAAISGAVRYLEQLNLIGREREPGSRRDHYRVYEDGWVHSVRLRDHVMIRMTDRFSEGIGVLGADTPAGERMAETLDFWRFIIAESHELIQRWQDHRAALREENSG